MSSAAPAVAAVSAAGADKRAQVEQLLGDIFRLAEWPARVESKDGTDGGIAVAVHFDAEVPGVTAGKKSYLVDSLQFLVNKVINRPGAEKRWVTLGVGAFPEPRPAQQPVPSAPRPVVAAPAAAPAPAAAQKKGAQKPAPQQQKPQQRALEPEPEVELTPEWAALGKLLSSKAVARGRQYAVMLLGSSERQQLVKAGAAEGVKLKVEGDGHFRRVAFTPDKPTPMPRKMQFPDDEDDDEG